MKTAAFDPLLALRTLTTRGVRFVIIGGMAARLRGSPSVTNDLDLCYSRDRANLERLADALSELKAQLRNAPRKIPFKLDARTLAAGDHFTFETSAGNLDTLGSPAGSGGYDELERMADRMEIEGLSVSVASLDDLISMKRAAGRPKDRIELEILGALREEVERQGRGKTKKR